MSRASFVVSGIASFTSVAAVASAGDVLKVGLGQQHATIQAAVDAASDGDALLISQGTYAGFAVDGKALAIVADGASAPVIAGEVLIEHVPAGKLALLAGLDIQATTTAAPALRTRSNLGVLRIQGCDVAGCDSPIGSVSGGGAAMWSSFDASVTLVATTALAGDGGSTQFLPAPREGGVGVFARSSGFAAWGCTFGGGDGGSNGEEGYDGAPGGRALEIPDGTSSLIGCSLLGGSGGHGGEEDGFPPRFGNFAGDGGDGGAGVFIGSEPPGTATPVVRWRGSLMQGGFGGSGGAGFWGPSGQPGAPGMPIEVANGSHVALSGAVRMLDGDSVVREGDAAALRFTGAPGDLVYVSITMPGPWMGAGTYAQHYASPKPSVLIGVIPASGALNHSMPIGDVVHGPDSRWWVLAPTFVDTLGEAFAGNDLALIVVEGAL